MAALDIERPGLRFAVLFCALLISGPVPWYLWHAALYGPSTANIAMIVPPVGLYLGWSTIVAASRPGSAQGGGVGCLALVLSIAAIQLLALITNLLPLPSTLETFKTDGMQFLLLLAYYPWLLVQFGGFLVVWSRRRASSV